MPLPLLAIAGANAAIKGVTGLAQYIKGRKLEKETKRPEYEIPSEIKDKLSTAQRLAFQGLPEEQKQQFLTNMQRSTQGALGGLSTRRAGLAGIGALAQNESDSLSNLLAMDSGARMQNIQNLGNVQSEVAGYKDKAFDINKYQPFQEKLTAAEGLKGAGLTNIMSGVDSATNILGFGGLNQEEETPTGSPTTGGKMEYMPDKSGLENPYTNIDPQTGLPYGFKKRGLGRVNLVPNLKM